MMFQVGDMVRMLWSNDLTSPATFGVVTKVDTSPYTERPYTIRLMDGRTVQVHSVSLARM